MIKIGIIGVENSHALAFAKYFNLPNKDTGKHNFDNIRVVGIMGPANSAEILKEQVNVDFIAKTADEFIDKVDAIMITSRKGSDHYAYAVPFIKKGIPLFIDKPFTSSPKEADILARMIKDNNVLVMGGSGCKYADAVIKLKDTVSALRKDDLLLSAALNFNVMLESEYDGIYFYAPHLIEICTAIFGTDISYLNTERLNDSLVVTVKYINEIVTLHFTAAAAKSSCVLFGKTENIYSEIDISGIFDYEAKLFAEMLINKQSIVNTQDLVFSVKIIDAIEKSLKSGKGIYLKK